MENQVRFPKTGGVARVFVSLILVGVSVYAGYFGLLVMQGSELTCTDGTDHCVRQTVYPFGISFQEPVAPFDRVGARRKHDDVYSYDSGDWVALTLYHPDGTTTDYPGPGYQNDRTAETVDAIQAYMAAPQGTRSFRLASGSNLGGGILVASALMALLLVPAVYSNVCFTRRGDDLVVRVERRPLAAHETVVPVASVETVRITSTTRLRQPLYVVTLGARDRAPIDLGMRYAAMLYAQARANALQEQLEALLDA